MIKASPFFGIIIRKAALLQRGVKYSDVLTAMEASRHEDSDESLVTFGPSFDSEAADVFVERLSSLGLQYVDDFFVFAGDVPEWCQFYASIENSIV